MKRILSGLGLALAIGLGIVSPAAAQQTPFKVGVVSVEPFGGEAGVFIEIIDAVREAGAIDVSYERMPFGELIAALLAGRTDVIAAPMGITEERRAQGLEYTGFIFAFGEGLIVPVSDTVAHTDLSKVNAAVGYVAGSSVYEGVIRAAGREPRGYPTVNDLLAAVQRGEVAGALYPRATFAFLQSGGQYADLRLAETYVTTAPVQVPLAVRRGETALLGRLDAALATLKANGRMEAILAKWHLDPA